MCWEVFAAHRQVADLVATEILGLCMSLIGMLCTWSTFQDV